MFKIKKQTLEPVCPFVNPYAVAVPATAVEVQHWTPPKGQKDKRRPLLSSFGIGGRRLEFCACSAAHAAEFRRKMRARVSFPLVKLPWERRPLPWALASYLGNFCVVCELSKARSAANGNRGLVVAERADA